MKKLSILLVICAMLLSACATKQQTDIIPSSPAPTIPIVTSSTEATHTSGETELYAVSVPAVTQTYQTEDGTELFSYTAQHMQLILPNEDIADKIVLDFLNRIDASVWDAESILNAAQYDYDPNEEWLPYFYQVIYSPTRIDQGVLSFFGSQSSFSGGMHGSLSCVAANYDLTTGDYLTLGSIMHMDATKEDFIKLIIAQLKSISEDYYLYDDFEEGVYTRLSGDENLYEDFYFTQTGLCFFFSPYEIAPYSSGVISVEIPYQSLTGLIYDGYFPAEREQVSGSMHAASFMETDMERFSNMAEVTLTTGEEIMVVYPEGNVEDIRIKMISNGANRPEYILFAALEMSDQDAVVISMMQEDMKALNISYTVNGDLESFPLV